MIHRHERSPIIGSWRIVDMEVWDRDAFELEGPATFTFEADGTGGFHLIAVQGWIDARFVTREGQAAVEFSWEGNNERDPASGRGWAILEEDRLVGRLFLHLGDDSAFTAERWAPLGPRTRKGR
jgi:hypothetical protein